MEAWYALYTKPQQETLVAEQLRRHGLETFAPQYVERRRDRTQVHALFPGYLFVRADLELIGLSVLQWTPGLRGVVSFGGVPARVPEAAIVLVRRQVERLNLLGGMPKPRFQPGERVRLKEGPLAGLEAVFEGPAGPAERVRILVRFLGQANRAVVPADLLEGVQPNARPPRRTRGPGRPIRGTAARQEARPS